MIVDDVADEIVAQLDTIAGLRCYKGPPHSVTPPAAILPLPTTGEFDQTYGRGLDMLTFSLVVLVGKPDDRVIMKNMGQYLDGSGAASIKAVLQAGTYTTLHSLRVASWETDTVNWQGTEYAAAVFEIEVYGQGSA